MGLRGFFFDGAEVVLVYVEFLFAVTPNFAVGTGFVGTTVPSKIVSASPWSAR